ncbi:serine/threonine-protein kinase [Nocardia sp. IFM 10818]
MPDELLPGTLFAGFHIERLLGRGGMGAVYLARHPRLPRYVALKVLPDSLGADPEYRSRFGREAELAAQLDHPNVVAVWDRGIEGGCLWIAMEFVDGPDAAALLRRTPGGLPPDVALDIVVQVAGGLDEAHRAGMLHRDVKPANFLIESQPGRPDRVYVSDFGIARTVAHQTTLTRPGTVVATLAYAAPEQIEARPLDHRVDVYALGCALYELLTGLKPFPRRTDVEVLVAHLQDPPPRASAADPRLPAAIDDVIAQAMSKEPADRFDSCGALARAALAAFATGEPSRVRRNRRRRWVAAALPVAAVAAVAVGFVMANTRSVGDADLTDSLVVTTPVNPVTWGNYDFVVETFPSLLPSSPISSGFQGTRCVPSETGSGDLDPWAAVGSVATLGCRGDGDPVQTFLVRCNSDRSVIVTEPDPSVSIEGTESWKRGTGEGRITWWSGTDYQGTAVTGLSVQFDDAERNFCMIQVVGKGSSPARELVDRWFAVAPI